jgi:plasmid stabilization system protein ParE
MAPQRPILSAEALADLDEIWLYIARDNLTAADRVIREIYEASISWWNSPARDICGKT